MTTLYIIGNGFDLFHALPTDYSSYRDYLERENPKTKQSFDESPLLRDIPGKDGRWSDVERALKLGGLSELFLNALDTNQVALSDDDPRWSDSQFFLSANTRFIEDFAVNSFYSWLDTIDLNNALHMVQFNKNALFVTFNYTKLLEKHYGVRENSVLHIHGVFNSYAEAMDGPEANGHRIQFGSPDNNAPKLRRSLESTCRDHVYGFPDDWHYGIWIEPCIATLERACMATEKRLSDNLLALSRFLAKKSICNVCVFGHTYDGVDEPYYQDFFLPRYKHLPWTFVVYGEDKKQSVKAFCRSNGIKSFVILDDCGIEFLNLRK